MSIQAMAVRRAVLDLPWDLLGEDSALPLAYTEQVARYLLGKAQLSSADLRLPDDGTERQYTHAFKLHDPAKDVTLMVWPVLAPRGIGKVSGSHKWDWCIMRRLTYGSREAWHTIEAGHGDFADDAHDAERSARRKATDAYNRLLDARRPEAA